jgi:hypothetical protein
VARGSVLDHRFGRDAYTLGVEEEYMLLGPDSFDLVQHVEAILADMSGNSCIVGSRDRATHVCTRGIELVDQADLKDTICYRLTFKVAMGRVPELLTIAFSPSC